MVARLRSAIAREMREALPPLILFLFLFHMIALTQAVSQSDYSLTALRASVATIGALIVAKAMLVVEALPVSRLFARRLIVNVLWKTLLFGAVALAFRFIEETISHASKEGGWRAAARGVFDDVSGPRFAVFALWLFGALLLYNIAAELVRVLGADRTWRMFFATRNEG